MPRFEKQKIRWGIVGPGHIASEFVSDLKLIGDAKVEAVASRSLDRARGFADRFGIPRAYGSYEEMIKSGSIDIAYIATPNNLHLMHTLQCLEHGVAVLCEKPISLNQKEVEIMCKAARANQQFLMEALWTRFIPAMLEVLEAVRSGELGEIMKIDARFCFDTPVEPDSILYDLRFGGGSILDIGVYPVFLSYILLGIPKKIEATGQLHEGGADQTCSMRLEYTGGKHASLYTSIIEDSSTAAIIRLTNGEIRIEPDWWESSMLTITKRGEESQEISCPPLGRGFSHEIQECHRCLRSGLPESPKWSHQNSIELMGILDEIRRQVGVVYKGRD